MVASVMLLSLQYIFINFTDAVTNGVTRVPISWCAVYGSPVASDPTRTDDILWSRHEVVTDSVYLAQGVLITLRSGINDAIHGSFNFPIINDPSTTTGGIGNVNSSDPFEITDLVDICIEKWINLIETGAVGGTSGIVSGIPTINIDRFILPDGSIDNNIIGASMCDKLVVTSMDCRGGSSWYARVLVIDNCYTAIGMTCGIPGWNNDRYDQNLAHEVAHALGLNHRINVNALMNDEQVEDPVTGEVTNYAINATEKSAMEENARLVPNAEIDPPNTILQGNIVQAIKIDSSVENKSLLPYENLRSNIVTLDKETNIFYIGQELKGLIPDEIKHNDTNATNLQYWTFIDLDNNVTTGLKNFSLINNNIQTPVSMGADMIINSRFDNGSIIGQGWMSSQNNNDVVNLNSSQFDSTLKTVYIEYHYKNTEKGKTIQDKPIFNIVESKINNTNNLIGLDRPFSIESLVTLNDTIIDNLNGDKLFNETSSIILKQPQFPQCFTESFSIKGNKTGVEVTGLLPNNNIHLLVGDKLIANDTTNSHGNSTIEFVVPSNITSGLHLITVGVDKTALTADCEINVLDPLTTQSRMR